MSSSQNNNAVFKQAIEDIDRGDAAHLEQLIDENPGLLAERFDTPGEGYFANPYLLWFVANNPIRHEIMPENTLAITQMLIRKAKVQQVTNLQHQLEYTLALAVSGRIPKEAGVQLPLAELLISEGATPGGTIGALAHNNVDAARFLTGKGEPAELITAICLDLPGAKEQAMKASDDEKELALVGAAFYGMAPALKMLISLGTNVNAYPDRDRSMGFHSHATALHQAICSGSLEAVQLLVEAGANLELKDRIYGGTPLGWAEYGLTGEENDTEMKEKLRAIIGYLKGRP
jgi:hypothetical protein